MIPYFITEFIFYQPWGYVIVSTIICTIFVWLFPLPFEFWETDYLAIFQYVTFNIGFAVFFTGAFWERHGLDGYNFIGSLILIVTMAVMTVFRLIYRLSKNYASYSILTEKQIRKAKEDRDAAQKEQEEFLKSWEEELESE